MSGDIISIELGLTESTVVTLWAQRWEDEDGDVFEAFLGDDDSLFVFDDLAEFAAYIRSDIPNDLREHPDFDEVLAWSVVELRPDNDHRYDLVAVPELAAGVPDTWTVRELRDTLELTEVLGQVAGLEQVTTFFDRHPELSALTAGADAFFGRTGERAWTAIGRAIADGWDGVVDAIDDAVRTPKVSPADVEAAREEFLEFGLDSAVTLGDDDLTSGAVDFTGEDTDEETADDAEPAGDLATEAAAVNTGRAFDLADGIGEFDDEAADELEPLTEAEEFWASVGIDPVSIYLGGQQYFTLRCYLDSDPLFLGRDGKITVLPSARGLARYLADADDHALTALATFDDVQARANDGSLPVEVTADNVYDFAELAEAIADGPEAIDPDQLELAIELVSDAATFAGDPDVDAALAPAEPLGFLVGYVLAPDREGRLAPSAPFNDAAAAWRGLERELENRFHRPK